MAHLNGAATAIAIILDLDRSRSIQSLAQMVSQKHPEQGSDVLTSKVGDDSRLPRRHMQF